MKRYKTVGNLWSKFLVHQLSDAMVRPRNTLYILSMSEKDKNKHFAQLLPAFSCLSQSYLI